MSNDWFNDARKIPDETMSYLRKIAVRAVEEKGYSPESVAELLGLSRTSIYAWLRRYHAEGYEALETKSAPGASPVITPEMDDWLKRTVLEKTPLDFGYDTPLWTRAILAALLEAEFEVHVDDSTVGRRPTPQETRLELPKALVSSQGARSTGGDALS